MFFAQFFLICFWKVSFFAAYIHKLSQKMEMKSSEIMMSFGVGKSNLYSAHVLWKKCDADKKFIFTAKNMITV